MRFNPTAFAFKQDPYAHYDWLRHVDPVHRSPLGAWFLGTYQHAREVLKSSDFSVQDVPGQLRRKDQLLGTCPVSSPSPKRLDALIASSEHWLIFLDGPDHTRLRKLVLKAFQRQNVERMRESVNHCAAKLLEPVLHEGRLDLIHDFASRLPQRVIAHLLGIPEPDVERCVAWTEVLGRVFDPLVSLRELQHLNLCAAEFMDYARRLIQIRRADPRDDLLSALIATHDQGDTLSEAELVAMILLTFGAGEETTVNLIGNGSLALIRHTEQQAQLRNSPEIIASAVEEFLRYDAPVQMISRTARVDTCLGGKEIRAGDQLYVVIGSANRDPQRFEQASTLLLTREDNPHLSFAPGRHLCVGAELARMEAQEAFRVLLERVPDLRLATPEAPLAWRKHVVLRGLRSLPVRFTPPRRYSSSSNSARSDVA